MSLEERTLQLLDKNKTMRVRALYGALSANDPSLSQLMFTDMIWRLSKRGMVSLEDSFRDDQSFVGFLRLWDVNLPLYVCLTLVLATVFSIYELPSSMPWQAIRWVLGSIFVLFVPGWVAVDVLFPRQSDLDSVKRFALSIGLSLVLTMFLGFLLNYTPWGIRLDPIVISSTILTSGLIFIALTRKYMIQ
jgi:uncharacterized membrane protein